MQQTLQIPLFEWLIGGSRIGGDYNTYYGSQTERPQESAWGQKVFNYMIYIERIDETEYLKAAVCYGLKTFSSCDESEIIRRTFACEKESMPQVRSWLEAERDACFAKADT